MANMEQFVPPWTVHRQVWSDYLKAAHSGVSTNILLFSDLNLLLTHHYRVHKRGLPHIAFQKDYMSKLQALLPVPMVLPSDTASPPVELRDESPQRTRLAQRRIRPVQVMNGSGCDLPILTLQDPADAQGAVVYGCRPPLLPVSLQLGDMGTFVAAGGVWIGYIRCTLLGGSSTDAAPVGCPSWSSLFRRGLFIDKCYLVTSTCR